MQIKTTDYTITTDTPPSHYKYCYEQYLYHRSDYLKCQPELPACTFWFCDHDQIYGVMHFHFKDKIAISHAYAPFGSFNGKELPISLVENSVSFIIENLAKKGLNEMELKHPAPFYYYYPGWAETLNNLGFSARNSINHHLVVDNVSLRDKIHVMEKRKLAKCRQFHFKLLPIDSLNKVYSFIESCRLERNQSLSMTYQSLEQVINKLPTSFLLCTVSLGDNLAAAAIVIKVTSCCWYLFYPAHSKLFNRESPMVYLISELYQYARKQGVDTIDLGTSEVNGLPNEGLLTFKKRIGGLTTNKTSYTKKM